MKRTTLPATMSPFVACAADSRNIGDSADGDNGINPPSSGGLGADDGGTGDDGGGTGGEDGYDGSDEVQGLGCNGVLGAGRRTSATGVDCGYQASDRFAAASQPDLVGAIRCLGSRGVAGPPSAPIILARAAEGSRRAQLAYPGGT
jgi:hypothetical protein